MSQNVPAQHSCSRNAQNLRILHSTPTSDCHWQWTFWPDATTNLKINDLVKTNILIFSSLPFFRIVYCHLAPQIANFGQNGPKWTSQPWHHWFWHDDGQFLHKKNILLTIGSKSNNCINIFFIATFFEFLAALNAMVANESGIRRWDSRAKFWNL